jgi:hypothetical protein
MPSCGLKKNIEMPTLITKQKFAVCVYLKLKNSDSA